MIQIKYSLEQAMHVWLEWLGWQVKSGPGITPNTPGTERSNYGQVVLEQWLHDTPAPKLISRELRVEDVEKIIERST